MQSAVVAWPASFHEFQNLPLEPVANNIAGPPGHLSPSLGPSLVSKQFLGAACGSAAPGVSELACSGAESEPLACPHEAGDDVFCAPSESIVVACAGDGDSQGRPAKEVAPQFSA